MDFDLILMLNIRNILMLKKGFGNVMCNLIR